MPVGPIDADVEAPVGLVYQMLAAIGQGPATGGERSQIVEADGDRTVCDFWTLVPLPIGGSRLLRTREEVRLRPPDAVEFRHLDGALRDLHERITVRALADRRTRLTYAALYRPATVLHRIGFWLARRVIERTVAEHFASLRQRAEARASRSRVFSPEEA